MGENGAVPAQERTGSVRPGWNLVRIWVWTASSMVGSRTLNVVYPLLALWLTGSPVQAGWTGFALTLPTLLFYIPAGVLADRVDPRLLILVTEAARGLTVASVTAAVAFDAADFSHILAAAFVEGALWVFHSLGETALIRSFVPQGDLRGVLTTSETSSHVAVLTARPLGGFLFGVAPAAPFLVNTLLFFMSFFSVLSLRGHDPRQAGEAKEAAGRVRFLREMADGVKALTAHPFLRNAMALTTVTNLMVNTLIMVFIAGSASLPPLQVGLVLAAGGLGGVLGSALASAIPAFTTAANTAIGSAGRPAWRLSEHGWRNAMLFAQMWIWAVALCVAAFGGHPLFFGAAVLMTGCTGALSNVSIRAFEIANVERSKLARAVSVHRLTVHGVVCFASPLGGLLVSVLGTAGAAQGLFAAMAAVALTVTIWCIARRITLRRIGRQTAKA
ncbi:MFS transporter [Planomonospora alba]|uniref:MFS transporter n=1 Tax=Planomonospora alba TaxID=161354 RepID=A0ABP6N3M6_9ACTN